ncbi:MAG: TRAP transporter TatT component family protein [Verrucomicrobiota bacterium]|nr:TRAP transporter TatT component family protein [Verrucomicrobiota bacterium]
MAAIFIFFSRNFFWRKGLASLLFFSIFLKTEIVHSASPTNSFSTLAERAEKEFQTARQRFEKNRTNSEAAWQFGRACFDRADAATNNSQREEIATQGISVCHQLIVRQPDSAPGHYYLGMNLAQLARTKKIGALKILKEMEREFLKTEELDDSFDFAGADRNLGMLYHEAPGWPMSLGNKNKARQHLERAVKLSPDFPENRLYLIEASLKWGNQKVAQEQIKALEELWPRAKKNLPDEKWAASWDDWEKRFQKVNRSKAQNRLH